MQQKELEQYIGRHVYKFEFLEKTPEKYGTRDVDKEIERDLRNLGSRKPRKNTFTSNQ